MRRKSIYKTVTLQKCTCLLILSVLNIEEMLNLHVYWSSMIANVVLCVLSFWQIEWRECNKYVYFVIVMYILLTLSEHNICDILFCCRKIQIYDQL